MSSQDLTEYNVNLIYNGYICHIIEEYVNRYHIKIYYFHKNLIIILK